MSFMSRGRALDYRTVGPVELIGFSGARLALPRASANLLKNITGVPLPTTVAASTAAALPARLVELLDTLTPEVSRRPSKQGCSPSPTT
jgi:hypothetical protein